MNRRHFLGSLAALSAGMALDPERLLWVPGRKTYFDIVRPPTFGLVFTSHSISEFPQTYAAAMSHPDWRLVPHMIDEDMDVVFAHASWPHKSA